MDSVGGRLSSQAILGKKVFYVGWVGGKNGQSGGRIKKKSPSFY